MTTLDVTPSAARPENLKPVTIQLHDETLQKLKIVAILQDRSISELLADAATALVRRDLKKLLGKLDLEPGGAGR